MDEQRRRVATAQADLLVDVLSAWRDRYEDDDWPATRQWIQAIVPFVGPKLWGCLYVNRSSTFQGIAWRVKGGQDTPTGTRFVVRSRCGSLTDDTWPITRRQFRDAARKSDVTLPSIHATLFLTQSGAQELHTIPDTHREQFESLVIDYANAYGPWSVLYLFTETMRNSFRELAKDEAAARPKRAKKMTDKAGPNEPEVAH